MGIKLCVYILILMFQMKWVYVVVLIMALRAGGEEQEEQPRTFCGRHLANARLLYCFGVTEDMRKRSSLMNFPLLGKATILLPGGLGHLKHVLLTATVSTSTIFIISLSTGLPIE